MQCGSAVGEHWETMVALHTIQWKHMQIAILLNYINII